MGVILLLAMIGVPILEVAVFIKVGEGVGVGPTIAAVIATALAGTALLRHQGLATLRRAQESLQMGRFPVSEVFDGLCLLVAGALLLTPGFVTDAVGLMLFVPAFRGILGRRLRPYVASRGPRHANGGGTIIDGEYDHVEPEDRANGAGRLDNAGRPAVNTPGSRLRPPGSDGEGTP